MSLIFLEKDRNPHGESETYLYKDLRKEVAKAGQQKIKRAEAVLLWEMLKRFFEYTIKGGIEMTTQLDKGMVGVECHWPGYLTTVKTGAIPCSEGFEALVWLRLPYRDRNDWICTSTALMADGIPVGECGSKLSPLWNKEDPSTLAYGVRFGVTPCNLTPTDNRPGGSLSSAEPIRIRYSKASKKVTFTLGDDIYSQTGLPDDVDFAIAVGLHVQPMKAEV